MLSGTVSRTRIRVILATTSFRLSTCWMLAHTNAPGSRHPKRYLDVEEIIAAGIDVFATLNSRKRPCLGALGGIVVERQAAVVEATHQRGPARPHITESSRELGFAGELAYGAVGPSGQCLGNGL
jgi:hypothetical protein